MIKSSYIDSASKKQSQTDIPIWLVPLLLPFSLLYGIGLEIFFLPYRLRIRKRFKLPCRVVSIGNVTFGGTGKSPAVRAICTELLAQGLRPAVLSRGHGGRLCKEGGLVSDGVSRLMDAADSGDEPALLADALRGVPLAIGKDRRKSGTMVVNRFHPDIVVLDDGMQFWQLHRDVEIVLVNASRPFGRGLLMPAGTLREPVRNISRANVVIITGAEAVDDACIDRLKAKIGRKAKNAEIFVARRRPSKIIDWNSGEDLSLDVLKSLPVIAISGIANPSSFESMLVDLDADVREFMRFPDHCTYSGEELSRILTNFAKTGSAAIVTTVKDAVKMKLTEQMYVLDIGFDIENIEKLMEIVIGNARGEI